MAGRRVGDLASRVYVTVEADEPIDRVAETMGASAVASVLVVAEGRPIGIVSERDVVRFLASVLRGDRLLVATAGDLMTSPVMTAAEDDEVAAVATVMEQNRIRSVPVVDADGGLTGVIRFTDVLRYNTDRLTAQRDHLEAVVQERTAELRQAHEALTVLVRTDSLTGIGNRRAMDLALADAHARAVRYQTPYSVALADVDHFKAYNDTQGHPAGDEVLRQVAQVFKQGLRSMDGAFRYGGEELLAVLPETGAHGALVVGERLRLAVAGLGIPHPAIGGVLSVSVGIASWAPGSDLANWQAIVDTADQALYAAKEGGRNRVEAAT